MVAMATVENIVRDGLNMVTPLARPFCANRHCNVAATISLVLQQFLESSSIREDEARKVRHVGARETLCAHL